ncbi:MAG: sigma 54-interacting transcriptional regulator [Acidobacteriota bacterium]
MIESIKTRLWDKLKEKEVSLAMLYGRDGRILWHRGRDVSGKTVQDAEGFSKTYVLKSIEGGGVVEKEDVFIALSGRDLPVSAHTLRVKSLIIQQVDPELFLYVDSGNRESFDSTDREVVRVVGELLGETIRSIKGKGAGIAGGSAAMARLREQMLRYSLEEEPVLLMGETGVGKNHVAQNIHEFSGRKGAFVVVHTPTIPENLFESELFGHRRGAFTGAAQDKKGLVEEAESGTLFMDEIAEVPVAFQAKLLQFLDTRKYRVLGDTRERTADVRIIAATNQDVDDAIKAKRFREDLFFRLNVLPIRIPPLRERKEDIRDLIQAQAERLRGKRLEGAFWEAVLNYDWPGNVRELINVLTRAGIEFDGPAIGSEIRTLFRHGCDQRESGPADVLDTHRRRIGQGESFWDTAWRAFMERELNRAELKAFLGKYYAESDQNLKRMCETLNIANEDYPRFVSALHRYGIHPKK